MENNALADSRSLAIAAGMLGNRNGNSGDAPRPLTAALRSYYCDKDSTGKKRVAALIGALASKALDGDIQAIKEIFDRIEGKVSSQETPQIKIIISSPLASLPVINAELVDDTHDLGVPATILAPPLEIVEPEALQPVNSGFSRAIERAERKQRRKQERDNGQT